MPLGGILCTVSERRCTLQCIKLLAAQVIEALQQQADSLRVWQTPAQDVVRHLQPDMRQNFRQATPKCGSTSIQWSHITDDAVIHLTNLTRDTAAQRTVLVVCGKIPQQVRQNKLCKGGLAGSQLAAGAQCR